MLSVYPLGGRKASLTSSSFSASGGFVVLLFCGFWFDGLSGFGFEGLGFLLV
jgi:hypothetical protein